MEDGPIPLLSNEWTTGEKQQCTHRTIQPQRSRSAHESAPGPLATEGEDPLPLSDGSGSSPEGDNAASPKIQHRVWIKEEVEEIGVSHPIIRGLV
jgi:hypothetical protein